LPPLELLDQAASRSAYLPGRYRPTHSSLLGRTRTHSPRRAIPAPRTDFLLGPPPPPPAGEPPPTS
jgi:hypothetical protein